MAKLENIYAMLNGDGDLICYTPMSNVEAMMFGQEAMDEMTDFEERNPGLAFIQDPDYKLLEAWYNQDGTLDMIAKYDGGPCPNEGCDCRDLPYTYFRDGIPAYSITEGYIPQLRSVLRLTGAAQVSLEIEAH